MRIPRGMDYETGGIHKRYGQVVKDGNVANLPPS